VLKSLLFNSRYLENILTMVYFEVKENIVYLIHLVKFDELMISVYHLKPKFQA
jgi:hypothetical protein